MKTDHRRGHGNADERGGGANFLSFIGNSPSFYSNEVLPKRMIKRRAPDWRSTWRVLSFCHLFGHRRRDAVLDSLQYVIIMRTSTVHRSSGTYGCTRVELRDVHRRRQDHRRRDECLSVFLKRRDDRSICPVGRRDGRQLTQTREPFR